MAHAILAISAVLAACTISAKEMAMPDAITTPATAKDRTSPVTEAAFPAPARESRLIPSTPEPRRGSNAGDESTAAAKGRRTLSTAFVRLGPDSSLNIELSDGSLLVLRDVAMRAHDYCGMQLAEGRPAKRFCGRYDDVVAARPGAGTVLKTEAPAASSGEAPGTQHRSRQ